MIERKFIKESLKRLKTKNYIEEKLKKAGIVDVKIQRTTMATRIGIAAERPGLVIGRKGAGIKEISSEIEEKIGIENPQIEVTDIKNPDLNPRVITNYIKNALERGNKPKRVTKYALSRIMKAGAMGAEVIIKGTSGKGGRSRKERAFAGYLKKAGQAVEQVRESKAQAKLKQGALGIIVRIVPPEVVFPDKIIIKKTGLEEVAEETAPTTTEEKAAEKAVESKGVEELSEEVKPTTEEEKTTKEALEEVAEKTTKKEEKKKKQTRDKKSATKQKQAKNIKAKKEGKKNKEDEKEEEKNKKSKK